MKNDDFNGQDYYGDYGSQFNDELANTLANARNSASSLMRELNQSSSVNDINRALKDEKDIDEGDSNKELGESREKDKNDELGEGDKDSKELGKESKKERSDELGEESDSEKHDELGEKDEDSDEKDDKDSSDDNSEEKDNDSEDDKKEESDDKVKVSLKRKIKRLKIMIILGAVGLFLSVAFIAAIVSTIAQPFSALVDTVSEFAEKIVETGGKIMNLFTFKGYGTNEDAFWKELDSQYNEFSSRSRKTDELDIALLAATIHYNVVIDSNYFEKGNDGSNSDSYNEGDYIVPEKKSPAFYDWAYNKLGNWNTLILSDRGLSGALVSERYVGTCQPLTLKDWWNNTVSQVQSTLSGAITTLFETGKDAIQDLNLFTVINVWEQEAGRTGNPFGYITSIINDSAASVENFGYDIRNILTYDRLQCGYMEEAIDGTCDTADDDCTYKNGVYYKVTKNTTPVYTRQLFNDYTKYDNYLRKFYLPRYYVNCPNCAYKDYPEDKKKEIIESMIDDIYDLRDFYMESLGLNSSVASTCNGTYVSPVCASELVPLATAQAGKCPNCQCAAGVHARVATFLPTMDPVGWNKFQLVFGNAIDYWTNNAKLGTDGFQCTDKPRAGSLAVWDHGIYGHILMVEHVYPDGSFLTWECNYDNEEHCRLKTFTEESFEAYLKNSYKFMGFIQLLGDC